MANALYSEQVVLSDAPSANFNRASGGYCYEVLLAMVAPVAPGFYCYPADGRACAVLGNRDNGTTEHPERIEAAAKALKAYGIRVRRSPCRSFLSVYGPQQGGRPGVYSR